LLGLTPKDYDVATNATPQLVREVFGNRKSLMIGAVFGVVAVVGPRAAGTVEVTTFRTDAEYSDGRHPDSVQFSTAEEDAQRRDFTINGLFYDPLADKVIDYVGGVDDLNRKVLRAIGDPHQRFREDKLRLLRAVRMATRFDFEIEAETLSAMQAMAAEVTTVSPERIAQELRATLTLDQRERAARLLMETGLLAAVLPEALALRGFAQPEGSSEYDAWDFTVRVLGALRDPSFSLALATLVHELLPHAPGLVEALAERWRLSNDEAANAQWLAEHCRALVGAHERPWSQVQRVLIDPRAQELWNLHRARTNVLQPPDAPELRFCAERLRLPPEELNPSPLVDGHDLQARGVPRGKIYSHLLEQVRDAQLDGVVRSKDEALRLVDALVADQGKRTAAED
jgi:tRNA nucleotidyltransferase/poly(A) polymerase